MWLMEVARTTAQSISRCWFWFVFECQRILWKWVEVSSIEFICRLRRLLRQTRKIFTKSDVCFVKWNFLIVPCVNMCWIFVKMSCLYRNKKRLLRKVGYGKWMGNGKEMEQKKRFRECTGRRCSLGVLLDA